MFFRFVAIMICISTTFDLINYNYENAFVGSLILALWFMGRVTFYLFTGGEI